MLTERGLRLDGQCGKRGPTQQCPTVTKQIHFHSQAKPKLKTQNNHILRLRQKYFVGYSELTPTITFNNISKVPYISHD